MERLTKAYEDGIHVAADNLPCGENSWKYKELLLNKLGAYEDTGLEPVEIVELKELLESAVEELENMYERETELTERIREII